jgi:hypothetical protein
MDDLTALAKEGDDSVRSQAIIAFTNGDEPTVRAALKAHSTAPSKPALSQEDAQHKALKDAFKRASKAARRRFVTDHVAELRALLDEVAE